MIGSIKNRLKRNSMQSTKKDNEKKGGGHGLKVSASTPVLSLSSAAAPQPPIYLTSPSLIQLSSKQQEKLPAVDSKRASTISHHHHHQQASSTHSNVPEELEELEEEEEGDSSATSSSSASISMPATPPVQPYQKHPHPHHKHHRYASSNVSLPTSFITQDIFLNHNHLKPGNQAELLSYQKTIIMYRENAKRTNDPSIQCDLAIYLFESSKGSMEKEKVAYLNEALKMLKQLSFRGHAESQYYLANIYASGQFNKSNKPDFGNAFPLFVQAAKHQHADAAYR